MIETVNVCHAFEVWHKDKREWTRTINERTAGRAKKEYFDDVSESWDVEFIDIRARKIGMPHTSERFKENAKYRGFPEVVCGTQVRVGEAVGVIVGHNSSANFDVLFDEDSRKWANLKLNVHPSEVKIVQ